MSKACQIPVMTVIGKTLPEVWEKAVLRTWEEGLDIETEYDKAGDPPSKDATMIMVVEVPWIEPRIHRAFPGGLEDLEIYRQEVVDGIHDHWINPQEGKWEYTYHERLFSYPGSGGAVDQISYIVNTLSAKPYSRRAQAIAWDPEKDTSCYDPACFQRLWCRLSEGKGGTLYLNMNTHWRSRDAFKAAFMNIFAFTDLQRVLARRIAAKTGRPVEIGRYVDISDSFHIYGSYYPEFKRFLDMVGKRSFAERTWDSGFAESFFEEARKRIHAEKNRV